MPLVLRLKKGTILFLVEAMVLKLIKKVSKTVNLP